MLIENYHPHDEQGHKGKGCVQIQALTPPPGHPAEKSLGVLENYLREGVFEFKDAEGRSFQRVKLAKHMGKILIRKSKKPDGLKAIEDYWRLRLPEVLVNFLKNKGVVKVGRIREIDENGDLEMKNPNELAFAFYDHADPDFPDVLPLPLAIANNFTTDFVKKEFSPEQEKALSDRFFVFAYFFRDDSNWDYLFFTREGDFGSFLFNEQDYPHSKARLEDLLNGRAKPESFDALISRYVGLIMFKIADMIFDR